MKSIFFLRSQNPDTDSRLQRYLKILNMAQAKYTVLGWNRDGKANKSHNIKLYDKPTPIGGGMANILALFFWNIYLLKNLFSHRKEFSHIHSVDFDTCIPAFIIGKLFKKKIIFDVYDKYTDSRSMPLFIGYFIDKIEYLCCVKADYLILPDECRIQQLKITNNQKNLHIFENVPDINIKPHQFNQNHKYDFTLSYVGILEAKHRGLENLIQVIKQWPNIQLLIAGTGQLTQLVENAALQYENITYYGQVEPKQALEIMNQSDIIVGMYYKTIKNHLYASPNKYFEHLMLGKALLTTEGTPPGKKVLQRHTGYAIGEEFSDIVTFLENLSTSEIDIFSTNAKRVWENKYKSYSDSLQKTYLCFLN